MVQELLAERKLPTLLRMADGRKVTRELWPERRKEILRLLSENEYGFTPQAPRFVHGEVLERRLSYAGKGYQERVRLSFETGRGEFSFEITLLLPVSENPSPAFVHINFRPNVPDIYLPAEELIDSGFAVAQFCYLDVVNDNYHGDYSDGLGRLFFPDGRRASTGWGKIGMWAYAASRVMDYLLTRSEIDGAHVSVAGHSRLGKTALWCGAQDERFYATISNDSGAGGAAILRQKTGEHIKDFVRSGLWDWFCDKHVSYADCEEALPLDQHFLAALIAPRYLKIDSAIEDTWADPCSEYLTCVAVSEVYALLGRPGLSAPDRLPVAGDVFADGAVGYHLRCGAHFFSREDWQHITAFVRAKMEQD